MATSKSEILITTIKRPIALVSSDIYDIENQLKTDYRHRYKGVIHGSSWSKSLRVFWRHFKHHASLNIPQNWVLFTSRISASMLILRP